MRQWPEIPTVNSRLPECFSSGHLWILEAVVGAPLRFRLRESGQLAFGDADRVYAEPEAMPEQYQHALNHIQSAFDRERLRKAIKQPTEIVFFGTALQYRGLEYDWEQAPSFVGQEIWSATDEQFRPPDATEGIFERLGLEPINPLEKELPARDFDPERYGYPQSAWYDGPVAGIVIRDKQGHRASRPNPAVEIDNTPQTSATNADELAAMYGSDSRLSRLLSGYSETTQAIEPNQLFERAFESAVRELHPRVFAPAGEIERAAFRSALAARSGEFLQNNTV